MSVSQHEYDRLLELRQKILARAVRYENDRRHVMASLEREKASGVAAAIALLKSQERRLLDNETKRAKYRIAKLKEARE